MKRFDRAEQRGGAQVTHAVTETTYLIHMLTTGRLPNTTPATQKAKQAVAITTNCGFLVENGPIDRCTQSTAGKETRAHLQFQLKCHFSTLLSQELYFN